MHKSDIAGKEFYISEICNVLNAKIISKGKPVYVKNRHSDAFVYVTQGSCSYCFDGGEYTVSVNEGDVLYLPEKADYVMNVESKVYCALYCDFKFLFSEELRGCVVNDKKAEELFIKLYNCYNNGKNSSFQECMAVLYSIYALFNRRECREYIDNSVGLRMTEAKEFIEMNFKNKELSVAMLAEKAGMSDVYFRKLFKARFGTAPTHFITRTRIEKAKQLMNYAFMTLQECAEEAGFSSLQYFCRVFKSETGMSPGAYRKCKKGI